MPIASADALAGEFDVCVVGAGPAGLACALACQQRGLKVLVLEAGGERPTPGRPDVIAAEIDYPEHHDPAEIISASALGGTSFWWGGRLVPFDAADFAHWPISHDDIAPFYDDACRFLGVGASSESEPPAPFAALSAFHAKRDEIWCPQVNMATRWRASLDEASGPTVSLNARVVGLENRDGRMAALVRVGGADVRVNARHLVLACGGLGTLRLLLLAQREDTSLFGGAEGPLGRGYMGHLTGEIADFAPSDRETVKNFGFRRIGTKTYARRRIQAQPSTIQEKHINPIAFWLDDASSDDPLHGSAAASARYVAARWMRNGSSSEDLKPHMDNIARAPLAAALGVANAAYSLAVTRITGHVPRSENVLQVRDGAWNVRYHAQQRRNANNRVTLSETGRDSLGLPSLRVRFKFDDEDIRRVVRAHTLLDDDLARAGAGRLVLRGPPEDCENRVRRSARDGYHQLGGAVMDADPKLGIVDAQCRAHGTENLWIASSSVFPSASHANPTFTTIALAHRLAATLATLAVRAGALQAATVETLLQVGL